MHSSGSFIRTVLERIRFYLDDADGDAKYNNDFIVRHVIMPCMVEVISQLNLDADNPIMARFTVTPTTNVEHYVLPPDIQMVMRVAKYDSNANLIWEAWPRGVLNPSGPGFYIDGNSLTLRPLPAGLGSFEVVYVPTGNSTINYSETGATFARSGSGATAIDTVTLPASPTFGTVDPRPNAYVGSMVRVLGTSLWEERVCNAYDVSTRTLTLRTPFTSLPATNTPVEVAPVCVQPLWDAIACAGAVKLGAAKNISGAKAEMLRRQYSKAMKAISDITSNIQSLTGKYFDRNTTADMPTGIWGSSRF